MLSTWLKQIQEGGVRGDTDHQLLGLIKTMSVAQKEELLGSLTDQPSVKSERSVFPYCHHTS